MDTKDLIEDANRLAEEIRRMMQFASDPHHRTALRHAEAMALALADELQRSAQVWPGDTSDAEVASRRSY
jgi:hypothetical protein